MENRKYNMMSADLLRIRIEIPCVSRINKTGRDIFFLCAKKMKSNLDHQ